jgi:hypothetical protein
VDRYRRNSRPSSLGGCVQRERETGSIDLGGGHSERRHALTREQTLLDCCDLVQYKYCIRHLEFMVAIDEQTMPGQAV